MADYKLRVPVTQKQEFLEQVERYHRRLERIRIFGEVREVITEEEEDLEAVSEEEVVTEEGSEDRALEEVEGTIINIGEIDSRPGEIIEGKK